MNKITLESYLTSTLNMHSRKETAAQDYMKNALDVCGVIEGSGRINAMLMARKADRKTSDEEFMLETPQGFDFNIILEATKKYIKEIEGLKTQEIKTIKSKICGYDHYDLYIGKPMIGGIGFLYDNCTAEGRDLWFVDLVVIR